MSRLDELIAELCPDGVNYKTVGSVSRTLSPSIKIKSNDYLDIGKYPIIDQGQKYIGGFTDEEGAFKTGKYVIFGDHTCVVKYVDFPFVQGADGVKVIEAANEIIPKFLYYCMSSIRIETGYARHWAKMRESFIPVPPLPVQQEIVRILDSFTELTSELTSELAARKKQYEYYSRLLLTFNNDIPRKRLGDICQVNAGGTPSKNVEEYWTNGTIKWLSSTVCKNKKTVEEVTDYITEEGYKHSSARLMPASSTLIALVGATIGKTAFLPFEATINQNVAGIYPIDTSKLNPSYVYYSCTMLYPQFLGLTQGKLAMANMSFVRALEIPVPQIEEQNRIVRILNKFDTLCNSMNEGIPAEIDARQKQYEYYRDKLLTFKRIEAPA